MRARDFQLGWIPGLTRIVKTEITTPVYANAVTAIAMDMPPKYGTGAFWVLRSRLGLSIAPIRISKSLAGYVSRPVRAKAISPRSAN